MTAVISVFARNWRDNPLAYINSCWINLGVILFPVLALIIDGASSTIPLFTGFLGIAFMIMRADYQLQPVEKMQAWTVFYIFIMTIMTMALMEFNEQGIKELGRAIRIIYYIPCLIALLLVPTRPWIFWLGVLLGCYTVGCTAIYDIWFLGMHRADGSTNAILFGDLSALLAFTNLLGCVFWRKHHASLVVIGLGGSMLALLAVFLSGSRGAWITLPAYLLLTGLFLQHHLKRKHFISLGLTLFILCVVLALHPVTDFRNRTQSAWNSVSYYIDTGQFPEGSTGARLEMWHLAWQIFLQSPLIGMGTGNYLTTAQEIMQDSGVVNREILDHTHPHNQFLFTLASQGIVGLIGVLGLLLIPLFYYYRRLSDSNDDDYLLAATGILLVVGYLHFGLTESVLTRSVSMNWYTYWTAILFSLLMPMSKQLR